MARTRLNVKVAVRLNGVNVPYPVCSYHTKGKMIPVEMRMVNAYRFAKHLREGEAVLFENRVATVTEAEFVYVNDVRMVKVNFTFHWQESSTPARQVVQVFDPEHMFHVIEMEGVEV